MKNKLRRLTVKGTHYTYLLNGKLEQGSALLELKVFISASKLHALHVHFRTWDDPIAGYPLHSGILLQNHRTGEQEIYNLNHPVRVREWIEWGSLQGWNGNEACHIEDGLGELERQGYEVNWLREAKNKVNN